MKVAFHFDCSDIMARYDHYFYDIVFKKTLELSNKYISSKLFCGDLLLRDLRRQIPNQQLLLGEIIRPDSWSRIPQNKAENLLTKNIFVICFETISKDFAEIMDSFLIGESRYIGALEIDNSTPIHWVLYGESLLPLFRLNDRDLYVFSDNDEAENLEAANEYIDFFKGYRFDAVKIEYSNYRYTFFDDNHNYEHAQKTLNWKTGIDSLFSTITDGIVSKLLDTAPELNDRLFTITNTFANATTGEEYAQAMLSCRRLFKYIADCLFPATDEIIEGHTLNQAKYKNRLIEFAKRELKSDTNIELIVANTAALFDEWNMLHTLSSSGVHGDPHRQECRRCIIRTVLLLDDLVSIKNEPFSVNVKSGKFIKKLIQKYLPD